MTDPTDRAIAAITRTIGQGGDPTWTAHAILTALRGLGWRPTNAQPPPDWQQHGTPAPPTADYPRRPTQEHHMTDLPQAAIDAAMDTIERLGAGGSRTTVRIVLEAAAPHIAAAERERLRAAGWKPPKQPSLSERAEEIHAEHHPGVFVPSLDSCPEHTRAEYEALVAGLLARTEGDPT